MHFIWEITFNFWKLQFLHIMQDQVKNPLVFKFVVTFNLFSAIQIKSLLLSSTTNVIAMILLSFKVFKICFSYIIWPDTSLNRTTNS